MDTDGAADAELSSRGRHRIDLARIIGGTVTDDRIGVAIDAADDIVWQFVARAPEASHVAVHDDPDRASATAAKFPRVISTRPSAPVGIVISARPAAGTLAVVDAFDLPSPPPLLFRCVDATIDADLLSGRGYALCTLDAFGRGRRPLDAAGFARAVGDGAELVGAFVPRRFERPRVFAARVLALVRNPRPMARALLSEVRNRLPR